MHHIVLKISFLDINSQNWNSGGHCKLWQETVKIQERCELTSNIPTRGSRAWRNDFSYKEFFWLRYCFGPSIFEKRSKKLPEPKISMHPKISYDMSINLAMEFFKYVLYFHIFLLELQMAAIIPILRINVQNLVQGHLTTWSGLIWVKLLILIRVGLY